MTGVVIVEPWPSLALSSSMLSDLLPSNDAISAALASKLVSVVKDHLTLSYMKKIVHSGKATREIWLGVSAIFKNASIIQNLQIYEIIASRWIAWCVCNCHNGINQLGS